MMLDYQDAVRQLLGQVTTAWAPTGFIMNVPNKAERIPADDSPWARLTLKHVKSEQRTIASPGQIYTGNGIMIVQLFTTLGTGISSTAPASLVSILQGALRGQQTAGGAFFMEVTPEETVMSGRWFQTNVSCRFQYDERLPG